MSAKKIRILIDTSSGLTEDICKECGFDIIGLPFLLDGVEYNDLNLSESEFFDKLQVAETINTSQASLEIVTEKLREMLKTCDEVLYFPITSGLSSAYNTGALIANDDEFKGKVYCVDHRTISVPERRLLIDVKKLVDSGMDAASIKEKVEKESKNDIWIVVDNFDYLKKGGRVDAVTATIGNILSIKPILYSDGGKFSAVKKERSIKNSLDSILEFVDKAIDNDFGKLKSDYCIDVAYSKNLDLAEELKNKISEKYSIEPDKIHIGALPQVLVCHTGPNTVAAALYRYIK